MIEVYEIKPEDFNPSVEVAACYLEVGGRLLILERATSKHQGGKWGVPAGKLEPRELPEQAASRELLEETGIKSISLQSLGPLYIRKPGLDYIYHSFKVHLEAKPDVHLSDEHLTYLWADAQDLERLPLMDGALEALHHYRRKKIVVTPYNPEWPHMFAQEAAKLQDICTAMHHVGSTAVPGLSAKPVLDMIGVVKSGDEAIKPLENLGFQYKGEYNIPLRYYFNKSGVNLHVYEEGHPEIELNLAFRDYLRGHPEVCREYAELKLSLLKEKSSYEKNNSPFTGYNLGKDAFIKKILKAAHFNRVGIRKCTHYAEWEAAKKLRQKTFFDPLSMEDPYTWTFNHPEHAHLILYRGVEIIGYAHIQFWPDKRAALRIIVIDEPYRGQGLGSQFLQLCEKWLQRLGVQSLHDEARPGVVSFYRQNGYKEMPFDDPSGEPPSPHDIAMGKKFS